MEDIEPTGSITMIFNDGLTANTSAELGGMSPAMRKLVVEMILLSYEETHQSEGQITTGDVVRSASELESVVVAYGDEIYSRDFGGDVDCLC